MYQVKGNHRELSSNSAELLFLATVSLLLWFYSPQVPPSSSSFTGAAELRFIHRPTQILLLQPAIKVKHLAASERFKKAKKTIDN